MTAGSIIDIYQLLQPAEAGVLPGAIRFETLQFAESYNSRPDSRRSLIWKPPDGLMGSRQRFGALAELLRSSTVALGQYPRRWSRTREGAGRSSRRIHRLLATFLRAKEVRLSSITGPALSVSRTTCLASGRVPRPGHVIKLSIFLLKNSTIIGT